ncbi:MAG: hypothetical protein GY810_32040 [Aureispira sp.]|nr:hypothetical protein [Aureispira sp.]
MKRLKTLIFLAAIIYAANYFGLIDKGLDYILGPEEMDDPTTITPNVEFPERNQFQAIDDYAFQVPKNKYESVADLADYLSQGASTELEKARIAFSWIANNIKYDDDGFNSEDYGDLSPENVLKTNVAVCSGFSTLYEELCKELGLEAKSISGYSKGYSYTRGEVFDETTHAWNAVKVDGKWKLLDPTWGSSSAQNVNGKAVSTSKFKPYWFDTDPYEFLFKHLPEDSEDQFIPDPLSKEEYEQIDFKDINLFQLGVSAKKILRMVREDNLLEFPKAWKPKYNIQVTKLYLDKNLDSYEDYTFKVVCDENVRIAFINNGKWTDFQKEGNTYTGTINPNEGDLSVSAQLIGDEKGAYPLLKYNVQ